MLENLDILMFSGFKTHNKAPRLHHQNKHLGRFFFLELQISPFTIVFFKNVRQKALTWVLSAQLL